MKKLFKRSISFMAVSALLIIGCQQKKDAVTTDKVQVTLHASQSDASEIKISTIDKLSKREGINV